MLGRPRKRLSKKQDPYMQFAFQLSEYILRTNDFSKANMKQVCYHILSETEESDKIMVSIYLQKFLKRLHINIPKDLILKRPSKLTVDPSRNFDEYWKNFFEQLQEKTDNEIVGQFESVSQKKEEQPHSSDRTNKDKPISIDRKNKDKPISIDRKNRDQPDSSDRKNKDQPDSSDRKNKDQPDSRDRKNKDQPDSSDRKNKDQPDSSDRKNKDQPDSTDRKNKDKPISIDRKNKEQPQGSAGKNEDQPDSSDRKNKDRPQSTDRKSKVRPRSTDRKSTDQPHSSDHKSGNQSDSSDEGHSIYSRDYAGSTLSYSAPSTPQNSLIGSPKPNILDGLFPVESMETIIEAVKILETEAHSSTPKHSALRNSVNVPRLRVSFDSNGSRVSPLLEPNVKPNEDEITSSDDEYKKSFRAERVKRNKSYDAAAGHLHDLQNFHDRYDDFKEVSDEGVKDEKDEKDELTKQGDSDRSILEVLSPETSEGSVRKRVSSPRLKFDSDSSLEDRLQRFNYQEYEEEEANEQLKKHRSVMADFKTTSAQRITQQRTLEEEQQLSDIAFREFREQIEDATEHQLANEEFEDDKLVCCTLGWKRSRQKSDPYLPTTANGQRYHPTLRRPLMSFKFREEQYIHTRNPSGRKDSRPT